MESIMLKKDAEKRKLALDKRLIGMTYAEIAHDLGISRQRVQQLICPSPPVRQYVFNKAGGHCEECGTKLGTNGHIHHKEGGAEDYNDVLNLELLCLACHRRKHRGLTHFPAILQVFNLEQLRDMQRERGLTEKEFLEFIRIDEYTWNSYIKEQGGNHDTKR